MSNIKKANRKNSIRFKPVLFTVLLIVVLTAANLITGLLTSYQGILQNVRADLATLGAVADKALSKAIYMLKTSDQAVAIEQIKQGLNQVSTVVQTNAATAEENSATSEQMSAQAATLRAEVGNFKLEGGYEKDSSIAISLLKEPARAAVKPHVPASSFGKY